MGALTFRNLLEAGDVKGLRAYWREKASHLPQPETDAEAETIMHRARTETVSMPIKKRSYSHSWLAERGLPSGLPDELKPLAERLYPVVKKSVAISVNFRSEWLRPAAEEIRGAMENEVLSLYADGKQDDDALVRSRILEVRKETTKKLLGRL